MHTSNNFAKFARYYHNIVAHGNRSATMQKLGDLATGLLTKILLYNKQYSTA